MSERYRVTSFTGFRIEERDGRSSDSAPVVWMVVDTLASGTRVVREFDYGTGVPAAKREERARALAAELNSP